MLIKTYFDTIISMKRKKYYILISVLLILLLFIIYTTGFYRHSNESSIKLRLSNICLENQGYNSSISTSNTDSIANDYHTKTTPVNVLDNNLKYILAECYFGEDIVGLYVLKVKDDDIINLWNFPPKDEPRVFISNINIQDIDKDGDDEISYQTYYHGGPCTWYINDITVYIVKYNIAFSKSIFAKANSDKDNEFGCSPDYKVEKSQYSGDTKQVSSKILEFINSIDLVPKWSE